MAVSQRQPLFFIASTSTVDLNIFALLLFNRQTWTMQADQFKLIEKKRFKHTLISGVQQAPHIIIVEAISTYIPIDHFKETFNFISELVPREKVTKLIFDKRKLSVFHQPSMEWYFTEWKEQMFSLGLTTHRKILPKDEVFRQSVKIGREKINNQFPNGKFKLMDIAYSESVEQAILD